AVERFGTDKPDLRFGMELKDLSDIAVKTEFGIFKSAVSADGRVKGICASGCGGYSRSQLEELNKIAQEMGAGGLLTISLGDEPGKLDDLTMESVKSVAAKFMSLEQVKEMAEVLEATLGDLLIIIAGKPAVANTVLDGLRREMGRRLNLIEPDQFTIAFVVDFPLLSKDEKTGQFEPMHHLFTSPRDGDVSLLDSEPEKALGRHYDAVCNGYEIAGGSIRIHNSEIQKKILKLLGYTDEQAEERFGHLLEAFRYGAPPHGGIAWGLDRVVMLLAGEETIREVIAFPKNQSAADLTFGAPAPVTEEQLAELHLRLRDD
ncbi:amino acid--tRNA ligase-related protein, partial [Chloroflexota bacterium]